MQSLCFLLQNSCFSLLRACNLSSGIASFARATLLFDKRGNGKTSSDGVRRCSNETKMKQRRHSASHLPYDSGSNLYDSFELKAFSKHIDRAIRSSFASSSFRNTAEDAERRRIASPSCSRKIAEDAERGKTSLSFSSFREISEDAERRRTSPSSSSRNITKDADRGRISSSSSRSIPKDAEKRRIFASSFRNIAEDFEWRRISASSSRNIPEDLESRIISSSSSRNIAEDVERRSMSMPRLSSTSVAASLRSKNLHNRPQAVCMSPPILDDAEGSDHSDKHEPQDLKEKQKKSEKGQHGKSSRAVRKLLDFLLRRNTHSRKVEQEEGFAADSATPPAFSSFDRDGAAHQQVQMMDKMDQRQRQRLRDLLDKTACNLPANIGQSLGSTSL